MKPKAPSKKTVKPKEASGKVKEIKPKIPVYNHLFSENDINKIFQ